MSNLDVGNNGHGKNTLNLLGLGKNILNNSHNLFVGNNPNLVISDFLFISGNNDVNFFNKNNLGSIDLDSFSISSKYNANKGFSKKNLGFV